MRINPMNYPNDITYEILSRVPVESALHCKRVCTTWRNFFDHIKEGMIFAIGLNDKEKPCFRLYYAASDMIMNNIKERHTYGDLLADFGHPPIQSRYRENPLYTHCKDAIVSSCNGLVCFTIPNSVLNDPVYICNPFIRESVNLPRLTSISPKGLVVSGFGFDLHNKQYKVVRIYYPNKYLNAGHVEVYTLGAGSGWRNIGEITYPLRSSPGILVNGVLYWIDYKAMKIVEFGLKDEKFGLLPSPPCFHLGEVTTNYRLKKMRGCLCVVHCRREHECIDLWFYNEDYNTSCSHDLNLEPSYDRCWSLEIKMKNMKTVYITSDGYDYDPFLVLEKNKVLYWFDKANLTCFDPETSTRKFVIHDSSNLVFKYFSACPHVNTRVSLKTLEKENCVVQEWDGCKEELDKPPLIGQPPTRVLSDDIIFTLKFVIAFSPFIFWCEYVGWPGWLEQLCQTVEPFISIPMLFIFIFFRMCIFLSDM